MTSASGVDLLRRRLRSLGIEGRAANDIVFCVNVALDYKARDAVAEAFTKQEAIDEAEALGAAASRLAVALEGGRLSRSGALGLAASLGDHPALQGRRPEGWMLGASDALGQAPGASLELARQLRTLEQLSAVCAQMGRDDRLLLPKSRTEGSVAARLADGVLVALWQGGFMEGDDNMQRLQLTKVSKRLCIEAVSAAFDFAELDGAKSADSAVNKWLALHPHCGSRSLTLASTAAGTIASRYAKTAE